jgi:hypothetical protein
MPITKATGTYNMLQTSDVISRLICSVTCSDVRISENFKTFNCFFDTGAPRTYINQHVITELALTPYANGIYVLNISLPNNPLISPHPCFEWHGHPFPPGVDMLIGMDIISKGEFIIAPCGINCSSEFEFRIL